MNYLDRGARVSVHGNPSELVRAVADNDYKTFTREKDLVINIAVEWAADTCGCYFGEGHRY